MAADEGKSFRGSFDELKDSAWMCSADISWEKDTRVQIRDIREHRDVRLGKDKKAKFGSIWFEGAKKALVLNAGHRVILKNLFGTPENCIGQWIAIYVDPEVNVGGVLMSGIRFRNKRLDPPARGERPAPVAVEAREPGAD